VAEFVILYFALQKIGCIPIAALVTHRFAEISQFVHALTSARRGLPGERSGAGRLPLRTHHRACAGREPVLKLRIVLGEAGPGEHVADVDLIATPATLPKRTRLADIQHRADRPLHLPALGRHDRHPQADPAHQQRLRLQLQEWRAEVAGHGDSVLLLVLPIAHNLPLACPGIQGFLFKGAKVVLHANTRPEQMFAA
jgi:2,3-dihydroxybenzoate-AMP ligase